METMTMSYTTTNSTESIIEMFLDGTANEVYAQGRLATVPTENGVRLVAYGNEVLADIRGNEVTLYTGHHGTVSRTVTSYIKQIGSLLNDVENREVTVHENQSPTLGIGARASRSAQFINAYVDFRTELSDVEERAVNQVERAIRSRMADIFG